MEKIQNLVEHMLTASGITGDALSVTTHAVMVVVAILLAAFSGILCRWIFIPLVEKVTRRTEASWDDVLFSRKVLLSACRIVPAIVIWQLLPLTFYEWPAVREALTRLTAIYITVMSVRTVIVFIDSLKQLESNRQEARRQYLYSLCSVLKIIITFVAAIIVVAIIINKDPSSLFAGLGAASAILMLAFQDTIKGLVAGIRLTSNDMLHVGDWITVPSAGANGNVEDITLTTVKVRNFDNTIVTVSPQALVDGSFQNWMGMKERDGRKQSRRVFFDFQSIKTEEDGTTNISRYRRHIEKWLEEQPAVLNDKTILVRQAEATQAGCALEFIFWLRAQDALTYEHDTSDIMEYIFAAANDYGLRIFQHSYPDVRSTGGQS